MTWFQSPGAANGNIITGLGCAQVSVTTAAKTLDELLSAAGALGGAVPLGSQWVYVQAEGGDIRFRNDGVAPTTSVGSRIYASTDYPIETDLSQVRLIAVAGTVTVNLRFEG